MIAETHFDAEGNAYIDTKKHQSIGHYAFFLLFFACLFVLVFLCYVLTIYTSDDFSNLLVTWFIFSIMIAGHIIMLCILLSFINHNTYKITLDDKEKKLWIQKNKKYVQLWQQERICIEYDDIVHMFVYQPTFMNTVLAIYNKNEEFLMVMDYVSELYAEACLHILTNHISKAGV